ncbi:low-density lipoprotein receptor-related protein 10 [Protopterus annectens]|uniref:low-density lipoprotein receptor-related protein 10 n=1 Tax=Protopterus annectens TaxID=7888 RepID=UPI001CFC2432|nr:low-density lipoprotein receptor-related protein 10 [Protopterus annectens]
MNLECFVLLLFATYAAATTLNLQTVSCRETPVVQKEQEGIIRSPLFILPQQWWNCSWIIVVARNEVLNLSFQTFDLPCNTSLLVIQSKEQKNTYKLCGNKYQRFSILPSSNVTITFHGKVGEGRGFQINYSKASFESPPCHSYEFQCRNGKCISHRLQCNGVDDCKDHSDEDNCHSASCGGILEHFYGTFATPAYGSFNPYHKVGKNNCTWTIDPHDSRHIILKFVGIDLGLSDVIDVYDGLTEDPERRLRTLDSLNNNKLVTVESLTNKMLVVYRMQGDSKERGFNATYQVQGYCLPWESPCGGDGGCFSEAQRCDGLWDCSSGKDEEACNKCPKDHYPCGGNTNMCFMKSDRCNYQTYCTDSADEKNCWTCQPGHFHCDNDRCIFETWLCDGQMDCMDQSDEKNCSFVLPRKVITAAVIGSLICGLLLVIALGCTCKLYAIRSHEYSIFAPLSRMEAEMVQQHAPPSYGQLIAQGVIPPVDDFPTENPNDTSVLGNLRSILQLLRQDPSQNHSSRRRRRNRHVRRLIRRLRRWGLLPRSTSNSLHTQSNSSGSGQASVATSSDIPESDGGGIPEGATGVSPSESGTSAQPLPQKFPLLDSVATYYEQPPDSRALEHQLVVQNSDTGHSDASVVSETQHQGLPFRSAGLFSNLLRSLRERFFSVHILQTDAHSEVPCEAHACGLEDDDEVLLLPLTDSWRSPVSYECDLDSQADEVSLAGHWTDASRLEHLSDDDSLLLG